MDANTPVIEIKGIGPKTVKLYEKLGLMEAEDFLYYFPRDYMSYEEVQTVSDDLLGEVGFFRGVICKQPLLRRVKHLQIVTAVISCDGKEVHAVWFHMPYLTKSLKAGSVYIFRARLEHKGNYYHFEQPLIFTEEKYAAVKNSLQPIYPLTKGLSNQALMKSVKTVLDHVPTSDEIRTIHFPKDKESLLSARKKLVFDEFLLFMLKLRMLKDENSRQKNDFSIYPSANTKRLIERLPYELTNAQKRVWEEVSDELMKETSMNRLVQGDVGSGKTIIAFLSAIMVADSGYQAAIMAPTEILATQHFETICKLLSDNKIDLQAVLLTGSMGAARKREANEAIESGRASIVIGTHALFQEKVKYHNLALVITDEQHRFGVKQRESLHDKNSSNPHVLVMSATPIPRTLAIILYGDLSISVIDEVPARRVPIKNCVVNNDYRETAYKFIEKEVNAGRQAYVICPLIEESEGLDCENVLEYASKLRDFYADNAMIRVGVLHGKMKPNEKNAVMDAFYRNEIQILVSTTVVEVGVNVPNATVMLIENAERFGLAQLHQLRGRIGRSDMQSYCIFMSSNRSKATMERLNTLNKSNDGFHIANEDLRLRGPGDFFGIRQSGEMQFMLGDIYQDSDVLMEAAAKCDQILSKDPTLCLPENRDLKLKLDKLLQMEQAVL